MEDELEEGKRHEEEWESETVGEYFDLLSKKEQRAQYERAKSYGIHPKLGGPNASFELYKSKLHRRRWWKLTPDRERRFRSKKITRKELIQEMLAERPGKRGAPVRQATEPPPLPVKKGAASVVFDVRGDREIHMRLPAREAIIAAYAQFRKKDFDHRHYEQRYGHLVKSIDRSGKWDLPQGLMLEDFVAYDAVLLQKARDRSLTQKLPQGTIRTRPPRVIPPPRMPPPERAHEPKPPKRERRVTAKELMMPPAADDVLAGPLSRLQSTVEDVIRGASSRTSAGSSTRKRR